VEVIPDPPTIGLAAEVGVMVLNLPPLALPAVPIRFNPGVVDGCPLFCLINLFPPDEPVVCCSLGGWNTIFLMPFHDVWSDQKTMF